MKSNAPQAPARKLAEARIDWGRGRVIGYSVPTGEAGAFDVVQLLLDDQCVVTAVANLSAFDLARDLAGMTLPSREQSAFELRIPHSSLMPRHLDDGARLEVRTARGEPILSHVLRGAADLLRLTEGVPADLLFEVRFRGMRQGAVQGIVRDRHAVGLRPQLMARINEAAPEPLTIFESSSDGLIHHFEVPVRVDRLVEGRNLLHVTGTDGQPLGSYPLQLGVADAHEADRRIAALEAEVAFLKHLVLNQNQEALPARLALLKGEIVGLCSEMLTLQRTQLEREMRRLREIEPAADRAAPAVRSGLFGRKR